MTLLVLGNSSGKLNRFRSETKFLIKDWSAHIVLVQEKNLLSFTSLSNCLSPIQASIFLNHYGHVHTSEVERRSHHVNVLFFAKQTRNQVVTMLFLFRPRKVQKNYCKCFANICKYMYSDLCYSNLIRAHFCWTAGSNFQLPWRNRWCGVHFCQ